MSGSLIGIVEKLAKSYLTSQDKSFLKNIKNLLEEFEDSQELERLFKNNRTLDSDVKTLLVPYIEDEEILKNELDEIGVRRVPWGVDSNLKKAIEIKLADLEVQKSAGPDSREDSPMDGGNFER
ncbi:MAG: hypothetical protein JXR30_00610 [Alphaproteobacteria bacterium]|nr:hypothetical protein [Alphaproteobacteria bacterium]